MSGLTSPPSPEVATKELFCIECGYLLRGLEVSGVCPECATPISKSIRGSELCYSDPLRIAHLPRAMAAGIVASVGSIVATLFLWIPYILSMDWRFGYSGANALAYGLIPFAHWSSAWLLATPQSSWMHHRPLLPPLSRWLRIVATARLLATLLSYFYFSYGFFQMEQSIVQLILIALGVAETALFLVLLLEVARLASDRFLTRHVPLLLFLALLGHTTNEVIPWLKSELGQGSALQTAMDSAVQIFIHLAVSIYAIVVLARAHRLFSRAAVASRKNWVEPVESGG